MAVVDRKVAFAVNSYEKDRELALRTIDALQKVYPDSPIIHVLDEPRLKFPQFCGQWTERWMRQTLATGADVFVKIDPDTRAYRKADFPDAEMFGQTAPPDAYWGIEGVTMGGAMGLSRQATQRILDSNLLRDEKYSKAPYCTHPASQFARVKGEIKIISLQDPILADVAKRLGITPAKWDGLHMKFCWEPLGEVNETATFVHPVVE